MQKLEKDILICQALGLDPSQLISHPELYDENDPKFQSYLNRRKKHEPIAYITGYQPFMGLKIFVDRSVLIPRPETEEMVEKAIEILKMQGQRLKVLDIGTGSGAIAVALAKNIHDIRVIGIDLSPAALKIAKKNAKYNKVSDRCTFRVGNLFNPIDTKADLIISNPPYIPSGDINTLMRDVRDWEPHSALNGGKDGLTHIKKIIKSTPKYLNNKGILILEFGINQSEAIKNEAKKYFMNVKIIKDLSGKDRFLVAN